MVVLPVVLAVASVLVSPADLQSFSILVSSLLKKRFFFSVFDFLSIDLFFV